MAHIRIWFQIITLIVGTGAIFYSYQIFKTHRYNFLKPFITYITLFNLIILIQSVSSYININFFRDVYTYKSSSYRIIAEPFFGLLFIGIIYALIHFVYQSQEKSLPAGFKYAFVIVSLFYILTSIIQYLLITQGSEPFWLMIIPVIIVLGTFIIAYIILIQLIFFSIRSRDKNRSRIFGTFGWFYISGFSLLIISHVMPNSYYKSIDAAIYLLFNIFPYIWSKFFLVKYGNALPFIIDDANSDTIFEKYSISTRQREIVELLLKGKSNREIANTLFIAPHTVKNHIYSLYQKLGVKSRYELVNFFLEFMRN